MTVPGDAGNYIPVSCLSPCHGFGGIVEQWKTSTHYFTYLATAGTDEVDSWTGPKACGNCHASDAIELRVARNVGVSGGGTVTNLAEGELNYRNPTNMALSEAIYNGQSKVAQVGCVTCHAVTQANDPHRTGLTYTPGSFPLRVPSTATSNARIEKSPGTTVEGTIAMTGTSNTCTWCHRSRKDVTNYIGATTNLTSTTWGPHEGPQADLFSAAGGYHFAGMTYGTSTHQLMLGCVDCHMPNVTTNANMANHSFYPQLSSCLGCHADAKNFDVNGGQSQTKLGILELQKALNDAGYLTRSEAAPYQPLTSSQLSDGQFHLDKTRPGGGPDGGTLQLTKDQAGALYNYLVIARDASLGAHNPKYTRQILYDAHVAITTKPPTSIARPQ